MEATNSLPTEADFVPRRGDLDANHAWRNFGGLSLNAAAIKFRERPEIYQEDFMFMGGKAFAFYFPVIEDYLRKVPEENEGDDYQAWILAHCIKIQFDSSTSLYVRHLAPRVVELSQFIRQNIARFGYDADEQTRIEEAWMEVEDHVRKMTQI